MSRKLALIVDDSRAARAVLARMLERHDLDVDTAESAGDAIRYLATHRPDVIFMDHMMPGMDGFQAVQVIKDDPRTATIPIMMYTSQEGDVYLSQARALGAVGVLPKQTRIADVSKALEQLRLIETGAVPADTRAPAGGAAETPAAQLAALPPELRTLIEALLAEHTVELRRFVVERLDDSAERIVGDLRLLLQHGSTPVVAPVRAPPGLRPRRLAVLVAVLVALALGALGWYALAMRRELEGELAAARARAVAAEQRAGAAAAVPAAPRAIALSGAALIEPVPWGEAPFAGARVERVQTLLERLGAQGFRGSVQIVSFTGRFCLSGSGDAAALAAADTPAAKCEFANAVPDGAGPAPRESLNFANMLATARRASAGAIDVQLLSGAAEEVLQPYPPVSEALTAAQWNRVAAMNNRVEIRLVPEPAVAAAAATAPAPDATASPARP